MNRKAVFLDRDGVINVDHGYVHRPEDFEFVEGIFEACRHFRAQGYLLIVVTNQSGIARGMYTEREFQELTAWMLARFRDEGVNISRVYHCPHHPDFEHEDERNCQCRKPLPGMILAGLSDYDLDPQECMLIGDSKSDMQAALAAGIGRKILVRTGKPVSPEGEALADEIWNSIGDAKSAIAD